jgi:hypothetical protein
LSQGILHMEAGWFTASAAFAGRDELQTQIIRKAMEAKQAAQKNEQGRTAMSAPRSSWHPKLESVPQT